MKKRSKRALRSTTAITLAALLLSAGSISAAAEEIALMESDAAEAVSEESEKTLLGSEDRTVSMYRMYNPNSGEHFYTASTVEKESLLNVGWWYEGTGWVGPESSSTPVYRMYNPNAGDHHYTTSLGERDMLEKVGWNYENIGWYSADTQAMPVYRQYNPNAKTGTHNYTTSVGENNLLVNAGWKSEGIGWYAIAAGTPLDKPEIRVVPAPENTRFRITTMDYANIFPYISYYDIINRYGYPDAQSPIKDGINVRYFGLTYNNVEYMGFSGRLVFSMGISYNQPASEAYAICTQAAWIMENKPYADYALTKIKENIANEKANHADLSWKLPFAEKNDERGYLIYTDCSADAILVRAGYAN